MNERHGHSFVDKKGLSTRARRVEGQSSGIVRMLARDESCDDILQQIAALRAAAQELAVLVVEDHVLARCKDSPDRGRLAQDLRSLLRRLARL